MNVQEIEKFIKLGETRKEIALSQLPRFIEELQQLQEYLTTYKVRKSLEDTHILQIKKAICKARYHFLGELPLGIFDPKKFKTPEPKYTSNIK